MECVKSMIVCFEWNENACLVLYQVRKPVYVGLTLCLLYMRSHLSTIQYTGAINNIIHTIFKYEPDSDFAYRQY